MLFFNSDSLFSLKYCEIYVYYVVFLIYHSIDARNLCPSFFLPHKKQERLPLLPPSMTCGPRLPVQHLHRAGRTPPPTHLVDGPYKAQPTSYPSSSPPRWRRRKPSPPPLLPNRSPTQIPLPRAAATAAMPFTPGPYSGVSTLALVSSLLWPPLLPEDSGPGESSLSDLTLASSSCLCRWRGRRPLASASSTGASSSPSSR